MVNQTTVRYLLEVLSEATGLLALHWDRDDHRGLTVFGLARLMTQPEFSDSSRLLPLMTLVEEQDTLIRMMENSLEAYDLSIQIGLESNGVLAGYSLLSRRADGQTAVFGILGPTRMEYRVALAALDGVARVNRVS
jgi:transcriptional regulator of heat shock response